jgi:hypothetical protein
MFLPANSGPLKLASAAAGQPWLGALAGAVDRSDLGKAVTIPLAGISAVRPKGRAEIQIVADATLWFIILRHDMPSARLRDDVARRFAAAVMEIRR